MEGIKIRVKKLHNHAVLPKYACEGDAAFDLSSCEEHILKPGDKKVVKTGISMAIPKGYAGFVWDRSGLAAKNSLHTLAGVIDSGYRGEITVVMINLGKEDFKVERGMRIAQMAIQPALAAEIHEVGELDSTNRDKNGFGSTGL